MLYFVKNLVKYFYFVESKLFWHWKVLIFNLNRVYLNKTLSQNENVIDLMKRGLR